MRPISEGQKAHILASISRGRTVASAAESVGIARQSISRLRRRDPLFASRYDRALAECEVHLVGLIWNAAIGEEGLGGDWRAAAWLLARRFPERWARKGS